MYLEKCHPPDTTSLQWLRLLPTISTNLVTLVQLPIKSSWLSVFNIVNVIVIINIIVIINVTLIINIIVIVNILTNINISIVIMIVYIIKIIDVNMIFNIILIILDVLKSGKMKYSIKVISESVVHFLVVPQLHKKLQIDERANFSD